jgi:hypothetical protein
MASVSRTQGEKGSLEISVLRQPQKQISKTSSFIEKG